jgi:hypothetical protein
MTRCGMAEADFAADQPGSSTTTPIPEDAVALTNHLKIELFEGKRRHIEFAGETVALTVRHQGQIAGLEKERTGPSTSSQHPPEVTTWKLKQSFSTGRASPHGALSSERQ